MAKEKYLKTSRYMLQAGADGCIARTCEDWIELPDGGSLYELPGRRAIAST